MSKRARSDRYNNALNTYELAAQQGYPVHSYEDVKQPIRVSGMPGVPTGWSFIFMILLPIPAFIALQNESILKMVLDLLRSYMEINESTQAQIQMSPLYLAGFTLFLCIWHYYHEKNSVFYRISSNMVVQVKRRPVFFLFPFWRIRTEEQSCKLILKPGMSVSIRQRFKGRVFHYADVVINIAIGADHGEVVLHNVKNYKKVAKMIRGIIHDNCLTSTRSMIFDV